MWVYSLPPLCVVFSGLATVPDCLQITNGAKLAGGLFYRTGATLEASGFFVRWSSLDLITFLYSGVSCSYNPLPVFSFLCLQFLFVSMLPALTPGPRLLFTSFPPPCAVLLLSWWLSPTFLKFRDRLPFQRLTFFVGISYGAQSVFVEEIPGSSADMLPIYKAVSYILILPAVNGGGGCAWVPSHPVRFLFSVALVRCCPWSGLKTSSASCTRYAVRLFCLVLRLFGGSFLCRRVRLT